LVPLFIFIYSLAVVAVIKGKDKPTGELQSSISHQKKIQKIRYVYVIHSAPSNAHLELGSLQ
jgi:hypothetical protein